MAQGVKTGGRQKGTPNKTTALLKDAILQAAEAAGGGEPDGLTAYLRAQALANPGPFLSLLGKVLPLQVTGADGGPIQHEDVGARDALLSRIGGVASRVGTNGSTPKPH